MPRTSSLFAEQKDRLHVKWSPSTSDVLLSKLRFRVDEHIIEKRTSELDFNRVNTHDGRNLPNSR